MSEQAAIRRAAVAALTVVSTVWAVLWCTTTPWLPPPPLDPLPDLPPIVGPHEAALAPASSVSTPVAQVDPEPTVVPEPPQAAVAPGSTASEAEAVADPDPPPGPRPESPVTASPPAPCPGCATVTVRGHDAPIHLGEHPVPGPVPAGTYTIAAVFDGAPHEAGRAQVPEVGSINIRCFGITRSCSVGP